jgi:type 1 glutamine amidotransferase
VSSVVFMGDLFPGETLEQPERVKTDLAAMMARGCGLVCVHYATGLRAEQVAEDGEHPLLHWMGGYFATRCKHHQSVARVMTATIEPGDSQHPALRGWKPFTLEDEPYYNNYFGPQGLAKNVTALATSMLPPESPKKEVVAWAIEREDGGRGMGIVMPHFFRSWRVADLRKFVLNGVVWSAKIDVPAEGVESMLPDLATFQPGAVEPTPRPQKQKTK